MGYMQGSLGLGMLLGPVISSVVYPAFKFTGKPYAYTFVFYGTIILIFGFGGACMLPSRLNKSEGQLRKEAEKKKALEETVDIMVEEGISKSQEKKKLLPAVID